MSEGKEDRVKLYCIFAMESIEKMGGNRGKLAAQAGHAYLHSVWNAMEHFPDDVAAYRAGRAYKITLVVDTVEELEALEAKYRDRCGTSLVVDAGLTVFKNEDGSPQPTVTCLGLGPVRDSALEKDIRRLRPLK